MLWLCPTVLCEAEAYLSSFQASIMECKAKIKVPLETFDKALHTLL